MSTYFRCELRTIEAWRDPDGWTWNNSQQLEDGIYFRTDQLTPRKLLRWFRDQGYLNERSKGRVRIYNDQSGLIEILHKNTHEPLFALIGEYIDEHTMRHIRSDRAQRRGEDNS